MDSDTAAGCLAAIIILFIFVLAMGLWTIISAFITMIAWNALAPLFKLPEVTYLQAFAINFFFNLVFGGITIKK